MKLRYRILAFCFLPWVATAQVNPTQLLANHVPAAIARLTRVGRLEGDRQLKLAIGLPLRNREMLTNLLQRIYDPCDSNYHHYLSPKQFAAAFGPTAADYESLSVFARAHGLKVTGAYSNRMLLDVSGSVSDIEKTLHVTMQTYQHPTESRLFYAPITEPSIALTTPVLHFGGLDDYVRPHAMLTRKKPLAAFAAAISGTGSGPNGLYWGDDFRAAYAPGSPLTGAGQTVGLLEFDGYYPTDISTYANVAGVPLIPIINVFLDGTDGTPGLNNSEVALDIEMATCMAPGLSSIVVYEGAATDDILNQMATDDSASQLSSSWSYPIDAVTEQIFLQFAAQGQSFFNSSGDGDAWVGGIATPCDDPNITIVGGTTLTTTGPGGAWAAETVWNWDVEFGSLYDGQGSGGGISHAYAIPAWQAGMNMSTNQGSGALRNIPDVAMTADNIFAVADDGQYEDVGGTSSAAALFAGFIALANEKAIANGRSPIGFINPALYDIGRGAFYTNCFHDITIGDNTWSQSPALFNAGPGYDLCTGWGTPEGTNLINLLAPDSLQISEPAQLIFSGRRNEPLKPVTQVCLLTNAGVTPLNWAVGWDAPWLVVSPSGGTLEVAGPPEAVTLTLKATANTLALGSYEGVIWFTNLTDGIIQNRSVSLSLIQPPAVNHQPLSIAQVQGTTASFKVTVTGGAPLSFQWQLDGSNLDNGGMFVGAQSAVTNLLLDDSNVVSKLTISNINEADSGSYVVIISNAAGTIKSDVVTLTLTPSGPSIVLQPTNQTALFGSRVRFSVMVDGDQPISYQWQQYGITLTDGGDLSGCATSTLTISDASATNIGAYTVVVSNDLGVVTSAEADLAVDVLVGDKFVSADGPPIIVTQPVGQSALAGTGAAFSVLSAGAVPLSYQWDVNGSLIDGATNATLVLTNLSTSDAGDYGVLVSNSMGSTISSPAQLSVFSGTSELITFDDLAPATTRVPAGYGGLFWSNFYYLNSAVVPLSGYDAGMVSLPNLAFNNNATTAAINSVTPFSLLSAYLISAWNDGLQVEARGYNATGLVYDKTCTLSATVPTLVDFDYIGVTSVQFIPSGGSFHLGYEGNGGTYFAMDNVAVIVSTNAFQPLPVAVLYSFNGFDGGYPASALVQGIDGDLYGVTQYGGTNGYGSIFKLTTNGLLTTMASLDSFNAYPFGGLVQGADGNLYGTTQLGGTNNDGMIFSINANGALTTVASFNLSVTGGDPETPLTLGPNGNLYGTTYFGGTNGEGCVFTVSTNGIMTGLDSFNFANGAYPLGALTLGSDGIFYGTTLYGGANGLGTVFRMTPDGALSTVFSFFSSLTGESPAGALTQGADGNFYGVTFYGGTNGLGTVFSISTTGAFTSLASFDYYINGGNPETGLIQGSDGNFYGTSIFGGAHNDGDIFSMTTNGALTTLISFVGTNGIAPEIGAALVQANDGNFYGTASYGGIAFNGSGNSGDGVIFRLAATGSSGPEIIAQPRDQYASTGGSVTFEVKAGGAGPMGYSWFRNGAPILNTSTASYSANSVANADSGDQFYCVVTNAYGAATTSVAVLNVIYASGTLFTFNGLNGAASYSSLVEATDGKFYGTTFYGGANANGAVFSMTTNGALATLASFNYYSTGANPFTRLVQGDDGSFYGTTAYGGRYGYGTVFNVTTNGALTTLLSFDSYNGSYPYGGLTSGDDGYFYGTTFLGGTFDGGTVFKVSTNGNLTTLASFDGTSGAYPLAPLVKGVAGKFFGTSYYGGANDFGTVFSVTTNGAIGLLVSFVQSNGAYPYAPLTLGSDGNYYGSTASGGTYGYGALFKMATDGRVNTLYSFDNTNGANPHGALVQGQDGNFYGAASAGGLRNNGSVFSVTTNGLLTDLFSFGGTNGAAPTSIAAAPNGVFFGATAFGGAGYDGLPSSGNGALFRIVPTSFNLGSIGAVPYGTSDLRLAGTVGALGSFYPAQGETVTVTINGISQNTTINDATGDFSMNFDAHAIPVSDTPYTITYFYAGNGSLTPAINSATTLAVKPLTITLFGVRTYDSTTNAAATVLAVSNAIAGDQIEVISGSVGLAGADVGTNAITSLGTIGLGGAAAGNYTFDGAQGTVIINPLPLALKGTRPYDGTALANASLLNIETNYDGTNLTLSGSATLAAAGAGVEPITDFTSLALDGSAATNYTLDGATGTVTVTPLALSITLGNAAKTYGQTLALDPTAFTVVGAPFGSEIVTAVSPVSAGTQATAPVSGSPYPISATGTVGSGEFQAANYQITFNSGQLTIGPLVAALGGTRNYDATTNAAASVLVVSNAVAGDQVEVVSGSGGLAGAYVGTNAVTSLGTIALGGAAAGNYTLNGAQGAVIIDPLPVTLIGTRPYDGTTAVDASLLNIETNYDGTNLSLNGSVTLAESGAGIEGITNFMDLTLSGSAATNYTLDGATGTVTVTPLIVALMGSRMYDATTNAAASVLVVSNGVVGDQVEVVSGSAGLAGVYVGTNAITSLGTIALGGSAAGDYTLRGAQGSVIIEPLSVILTGTRPYDATTVVNASSLNIETNYDGTNLTLTGSATVASPGAGTDDIMDFTGLTLSGSAATNYTLTGASGAVTVTPLALTITLGDAAKTYGQTLALDPTAFTVIGAPLGSETVTAVSPVSDGTPATAAVSGSPYPITATGVVGSEGFQAANYQITYNPGQLTVAPIAAMLSGTRDYDATTNAAASVLIVSNAIAGDQVELVSGSAGLAGADVGTNAITSLGTIALGGAAGANYTLAGAQGAVNIDPLPVNLNGTRAYDGTAVVDASLLNIETNYDGTNLTLTGSVTLADSGAGMEDIVDFTGLTLSGSAVTNYTLNGATGIVTVTPLALSIMLGDAAKTYGQALALDPMAFTVVGAPFGSETVTAVSPVSDGTPATAAVSGSPYPITATAVVGSGGFQAANYQITYNPGKLIVSSLTAALSGMREYDATTNAAASVLTVSNAIAGDQVAVASGSAGLAGADVGTNVITSLGAIALGGAAAGNYTLTEAQGSVIINPLPLTLNGTRPYDGTALVDASLLNIETNYDGTNLTLTGSATLATTAVGTQSIVDFSDLMLVGSAATNYTSDGATGVVNVTNPEAPFTATSIDVAGTNFVVCWQSVPGVIYELLTTTNLGPEQSWQLTGDPVAATDTNTCVTLAADVSSNTVTLVLIRSE